MSVANALRAIQDKIEKSSKNSTLFSNHVTIMAASKSQPASLIINAVECGITNFGENRVQEALEKWPSLREAHSHLKLHLIGPLQTNKARQAVEYFDVIQTVDRHKLADALAEAMLKTNKHISCFIQVNTGKEPQKAGIMPEEADALIDYCHTQLQLPLVGLMCIPPHDQPPAPHFAFLRSLAISHGLAELSMGMSDDFETAVKMGSTYVRLGRALFGERKVMSENENR